MHYGYVGKDANIGRIRSECRQRGDDVARKFAGCIVDRCRSVVFVFAWKWDQRRVNGGRGHAIDLNQLAVGSLAAAFLPMSLF